MRSARVLLVLSAGLCLSLALSAALGQDRPAAPAPELRKLHALLVIDTLSGLGESVVIDGERVEGVLRHGIPKERCDIVKVTGKDVTKDTILRYYRNLKTGESEGLFFFYAGHGAIDDDLGPFLYLQEGKAKGGNLFRSELRKAMLAKKAGLTMIVSDCCSEHVKLKRTRKIEAPLPDATSLSPLLRCLFFQHRGFVDVTAASDNCSWGDDHDGGLFTRNFGKLLVKSKVADLDTNHDGFVSWKEFFGKLQTDTERTFSRWATDARRTGENIPQAMQKPHPFSLSEGGIPAVTLLNETTKPVGYQYRWAGSGAWQLGSIPPGDARTHVPPGGSAGTKLETKLEGEPASQLDPGKTYRYTGKSKRN